MSLNSRSAGKYLLRRRMIICCGAKATCLSDASCSGPFAPAAAIMVTALLTPVLFLNVQVVVRVRPQVLGIELQPGEPEGTADACCTVRAWLSVPYTLAAMQVTHS
jgi:hypothetical protein